jgi:hypothetical protein
MQLVPVIPEGMDVAFADLSPVEELDADLEGSLDGAQHFGFVDLEKAIELDERRDGRFTNANRSDHLGLDDGDCDVASRPQTGQGGRGHPACGSAADNDDMLDRFQRPQPRLISHT